MRDELRDKLRPLSFGAAYKVLDMLVEHVLRANGAPPGRMTFEYKVRSLKRRPQSLPVPIDTHAGVWDRLAKLYSNLEEARHAVTHRRAELTTSGELVIYDNNRTESDRLTADELAYFNVAVHAVAEAVIDGDNDDRRMRLAAGLLNELQGQHGLPDLPNAVDPGAEVGLLTMDLQALGDDLWRMDVKRARRVTSEQAPPLWELELRAGGRVFIGRWEDVPDQSVATLDIRADSPPDWLVERLL